MNEVEQEYERRLAEMPIAEKVARSQAMFNAYREQLGREIAAVHPEYSFERLKWEVAARMYADEPATMELVNRMLERVSD